MHKTINGFYLNDIDFRSDIDDKSFTNIEILELFQYLTTHNNCYKIEKWKCESDLDDSEYFIDEIENTQGYQPILKDNVVYFEDDTSSEKYYITDASIINLCELENSIRVHDYSEDDVIYYFYFTDVIV